MLSEDYFIILEISILPSLTAISFQSQNLCHNKSTQHMAPQRSDLASLEGGMTHKDNKQGFQINIFH
jgi:hypothetical protein